MTTLPVDLLLWHEINQFYIREARLLDDLDFLAWVDLFTETATYWMPIVSNRIGRETVVRPPPSTSRTKTAAATLSLCFSWS